jgi:phosphate transport system substrate-binding protein
MQASQELTSTGAVIEAVKNNPNAVGYASLSAWRARTASRPHRGRRACTEATVLDGSYVIQRPFLLVTKDRHDPLPAAQAFFDFATSKDAASLIQAPALSPWRSNI